MSARKIKASISVIEGEDKGKIFELKLEDTTIGRSGADIVIKDRKISRRHATISIRSGKVYIKDMGSTNGVFVNDAKVGETELKNLDEITLGFSTLSIAIVEDLKSFKEKNVQSSKSISTSSPGEKEDIERLIEDELSKFSRWDVSGEGSKDFPKEKQVSKTGFSVEVVSGPDKGKKSPLRRGHTILGRGAKADISFKDTDISRAHAELEVYGKDQAFVRDLASTNGTFVNSKKVSYTRIKNGDLIQIGATVIKFILME